MNELQIDADVWEFADNLAQQALEFVRETTGDPCLESVSQWVSLTEEIAKPIQRLRNHAAKKQEQIQKYEEYVRNANKAGRVTPVWPVMSEGFSKTVRISTPTPPAKPETR